jgi:hypothetical protein
MVDRCSVKQADKMAKEEIKDVFTLDELASILGLRPLEDYEFEPYFSSANFNTYIADYLNDNAADAEDPTPEEAEAAEEYAREIVQKGMDAESDEAYQNVRNANLSAIETCFEHADLDLIPQDKNDWEFKIRPSQAWEQSLKCVVAIINGCGDFGHMSSKEFLEVNCCDDAREGVLTHLGYIKYCSDVYGGASPRRLVDIHLR